MFCHLGLYYYYFFLSWRVCYLKGRSLRCSPGRGNAGHCAVRLYVGEGPRGSNGARSPLHRISVFHSATHNQTGPISAPPTGLDEYLFFISLVSDFLAVQFSVSSCCARRRSVSTYTAILVCEKSTNNKFWHGHRRKGTFVYCWCSMQFSQKN